MNNIEFCNLVREAREISGKSIIDLIVSLRKSEKALRDLVKPKCDYNIEKYLEYLQAIGFCIVVTSKTASMEITNAKTMKTWVQSVINELTSSSIKLGEMLNISQRTAWNIMNDGPIRLSVFLNLVELSNSKITLDAII